MKRKHFLTLTVLAVLLLIAGQIQASGRIYFAGNYSTPYIWAWTGSTNVYASWPGQLMTVLPNETYYGRPVYYVDLEDYNHNCPDSAIFSDNGSNQAQTVNLKVPGYDYMFNGTAWMPFATTKSWYVFGDLDGGIIWNYYQLLSSSNGLSCTLHLAAGREYYFKIASLHRTNEANYSCGKAITRTTCKDVNFSTDGANAALATTIAGDYVFSFDTLTMTLSVTYPDALAEDAIYATSVPSENGDVMIQSYYWAHEGNSDVPWTPFGGIQWTDLTSQADTLGKYFDLVWLAPSAVTADYTGFLPTNYSIQSNVWGSVDELKTLINRLHGAGAKVVADIVINHSSTPVGYCEWNDLDFGRYGVFSPDKSWIANDDEIFISKHDSRYQRFDNGYPQNAGIKEDADTCGGCGSNPGPYSDENDYSTDDFGGHAYWSYAEYNCVYSRDWAHKRKEVREMCRAYLTWMKDSIGYDGWRYDFAKGIHGSHIDDYNKASNAAFAVSEVFDHDISKEEGIIRDAHYNTYAFDFPGKYNFINDAFRYSVYEKLKGNAGNTMIYNHKKYAVTFVENHDSFREHEHNLTQTPNVISDTNKVLMANAFILSMPGVPCVFYPHWSRLSNSIKPMIQARKLTGVHSESMVKDTAMSDYTNNIHYYKATITGKNGNIRLLLGPNSGWETCPDGYRVAFRDSIIGMYYAVKGMYLKHNWNGAGWTWKEMSANGDGTYSVVGVYGGGGCNWNDMPAEGMDFPYIETPTIVGKLVVGQLATFTLNPTAGTVSITAAMAPVYFKKPHNGWPAVYAYAWKGTNTYNVKWPGKPMSLEGVFGGDSIYSYYADDFYTSIIFNIGSNANQTEDLEYHAGSYYAPAEGWKSLSQLLHPISLSGSEWKPLYLPLDAAIPSGAYAYYAESENEGSVVLKLVPENIVPAKTGVLVKGAQGQHIITGVASDVESVASLLSGTALDASATSLRGEKALYALSSSLSQISAPVFVPYEGENVAANTSFLLIENNGSMPSAINFTIAEGHDKTTALTAVMADEEAVKMIKGGQIVIIRHGEMYNVLGVRIR